MWTKYSVKCDCCGVTANINLTVYHIAQVVVAELCESCAKEIRAKIEAMLRTKPGPQKL